MILRHSFHCFWICEDEVHDLNVSSRNQLNRSCVFRATEPGLDVFEKERVDSQKQKLGGGMERKKTQRNCRTHWRWKLIQGSCLIGAVLPEHLSIALLLLVSTVYWVRLRFEAKSESK